MIAAGQIHGQGSDHRIQGEVVQRLSQPWDMVGKDVDEPIVGQQEQCHLGDGHQHTSGGTVEEMEDEHEEEGEKAKQEYVPFER